MYVFQLYIVFISLIGEGVALTTGSYETFPKSLVAVSQRGGPSTRLLGLVLLLLAVIGYPIVVFTWIWGADPLFRLIGTVLAILTFTAVLGRDSLGKWFTHLDAAISFWCLTMAGYALIQRYIF